MEQIARSPEMLSILILIIINAGKQVYKEFKSDLVYNKKESLDIDTLLTDHKAKTMMNRAMFMSAAAIVSLLLDSSPSASVAAVTLTTSGQQHPASSAPDAFDD